MAERALGVLEPDGDPVAIQDDLGEQGVLGFYDPESKDLVVRGDEVTPYVETIIVHELTHALDDQYFDLRRGEILAEQPDESGFGFLALTEGSARRVQVAYEEQLSPDDQISAQIESLTAGWGGISDPTPDPLPLPFVVATQLPYGNGADLVQAIVDQAGNEALDAAFASPPTTSEQVLDPAQFLARDPAFPVPVPTADGPAVTEGAFGAVDLRILEVAAHPEQAVSLFDQSGLCRPRCRWTRCRASPGAATPPGRRRACRASGSPWSVTRRRRGAGVGRASSHDWGATIGAEPVEVDGTRSPRPAAPEGRRGQP